MRIELFLFFGEPQTVRSTRRISSRLADADPVENWPRFRNVLDSGIGDISARRRGAEDQQPKEIAIPACATRLARSQEMRAGGGKSGATPIAVASS